MFREDVVWRADTGAYHARAPVLMPPMAGDAPAVAGPASPVRVLSWLSSQEATNLLLLLILVVLILRE